MYHDKRFQLDPLFPIVAFNQEQISKANLGGYLLSDKKMFASVSQRVLSLDTTVLDSLITRLSSGEYVESSNEAEKECFRLLNDLDHVAGKVQGSRTAQKWKRSEAWSMITHLGAPSWFITIAPADQNSPLCLSFASPSSSEHFVADVLTPEQKVKLVGRNPVASARFFHIVVTLFIKHVLGQGVDHDGLFGRVSGYYGTRPNTQYSVIVPARACAVPRSSPHG
ncbi:uncharacterized protein STEHIDRAFT_135907 [Stereum hirsutum FP-91666 SS1]|uniref:Helitron helicase-like domain-containing protein n=1 Tax=Stereum hirsutum (strain FP-91666) TaxID=721885 RepID=R7RWC7_STEHR|nr:uncharacterized protein STEHIDRAFT_135907 [Stereum hirsutum FP-91666 SS1]EIM79080.1 hypothetical protein STEHIDRAFT_135907 [Stereum hirsutum FP-91666 SS1]